MSIPLNQAVEIAVSGTFPDEKTQSVKLGKHHFYVRAVRGSKRLEKGESGYIRHQIKFKDDILFYRIDLKGNGKYTAKITRIQYRGITKSGFKAYNQHVAGALKESGPKGEVAAKIISFLEKLDIEKRIHGNWEVEAAKIVDAIGQRMAFVEQNKKNLAKMKGWSMADIRPPS